MTTAADTLIAQYPTREAQLRGPVLAYLSRYAPFPTEQSFYFAVFHPKARTWPLTQVMPDNVRRDNPAIQTVGDYVRKVRAAGARAPRLTDAEERALSDVAGRLSVPVAWVRSLVQLESGWNPAARNPVSGARGLIQFLPSTAKGLDMGLVTMVLLALGAIVSLATLHR